MSPRVYASVKEAWAGVLSGAVPISRPRRRVSCSTINVPTASAGNGNSGSSNPKNKNKKDLHLAETQASTSEESESADEYDDDEEPFECRVLVQLSDEDDDDDDEKNQVNISSLSDEDLRRLKKDDPFLYYSIPSIRRRSYRFDIDEDEEGNAHAIRSAMATTSRTSASSRAARRRTSMPAQVLANADISRSRQQADMIDAARLVLLEDSDEEEEEEEYYLPVIEEPSSRSTRRSSVTRCRRLSTEAHPTLICNELLEELEGLDFDMSDDDDDEDEIDVNLEDLELQLSGI